MDWDSATGILAIIMIFGMPVFMICGVIWIIFFFMNKANAEKQKTLRMAIEKSDSLPPEFLDSLKSLQKKPKTPMNDIRAGLILIAIAAGLMLWHYIDKHQLGGGLSGIAAVPGLIGLALLILGIVGLNRKA